MSRRQSKPRHERVTETFHFVDWEDVAYNALTETLLTLSPDVNNLGQYSAQLSYFCDMYRFAKIERFIMEMSCDCNSALQLATDDSWAGWVLSYVPPGATPPTNLLGIETEHSAVGSGYGGSHWSRVKLDMKAADFAVLADAGPGPGFIPTQSDGPATSFGSIVVTSTTPAGTNPNQVNFSWRVSITMTFDQLVDPATIAALRKIRKEPVPRSLKTRKPVAQVTSPPTSQVVATVPCNWQGVTCACKNCESGVCERR